MENTNTLCPNCGYSEADENCRSQAIARLAVRDVFALIGVDIDNPTSIEEFRADLRFGKQLRKTAGHSAIGIVGVLMTGIAVAIWEGVKHLSRQ